MGTVRIRFREDGGSKWLEGLWQVYEIAILYQEALARGN
jgi:hypothetical protein